MHVFFAIEVSPNVSRGSQGHLLVFVQDCFPYGNHIASRTEGFGSVSFEYDELYLQSERFGTCVIKGGAGGRLILGPGSRYLIGISDLGVSV